MQSIPAYLHAGQSIVLSECHSSIVLDIRQSTISPENGTSSIVVNSVDPQPCFVQYAASLQAEILQLVILNPNFLLDNMEMNNLVESVRFGLKTLIKNEDNLLQNDLFNNLLQVIDSHVSPPSLSPSLSSTCQALPKTNPTFAKNIQAMKCRSSSASDTNAYEAPVRLHDKVGLINIGNTCYLNAIMQALYACTRYDTLVRYSTGAHVHSLDFDSVC